MRKNKNKKQSATPPAATLSNITASRKSRSKTRKPKYLSLVKLEELSPENTSDMPTTGANDRRHNQLDLFPLHPENLVDEKDNQEDNNVAYYFSSVDNGGAATLTGLLGANTSCSGCDGETLSPESLTYAYGGGQDSEEVEQLVRTAMRKQSRDQESSEEKWVSCCSETKSNVVVGVGICDNKRLSLKLDYQEIMDAWSDKGPLIVNVQSSCASQVVPDLLHDDLFAHPSINGWGSSGALWSVPEMSGSTSNGCIKVEEVHGEDWKIGRREASVLRYREKRQNRLFSKKIRYEVRKLNAEKRPRIKGRFVKRI